ncbi:DNA topoisomerase III [Terrilactibacillus sp. BCM23-1]|uniref:DNA topoisomerase n=1 Tax=Terrilactibacillus tamarindi TaxID=2599694 RepID=A0A6N8CSA6_9BACI|nr:DNA topoisomerase III [Terrilactibacillus tamarindi]MTT33072.1 DNA topoisomerase III [Terrilactibacillus tamarindi]
MKSLILAEKPSVAREIARVLGSTKKSKHYIEGDRYIVTWALGHLMELKMPEDYDSGYKTWKMEDLPIIPNHMGIKPIKNTRHQFHAIQQLANRSDIKDFIIATDAGREGELVARWILEKIKWKKPIQRLWISSQTDRAIRDGFRHLKPSKDYHHLYQSAVCRAKADWLIGLNVSRALTTKYHDSLSAGRVQTPTLSLIHEREKDIKSFKPEPYWTIYAKIGETKPVYKKNQNQRIFKEQDVKNILSKTKNQSAIIKDITRKTKTDHQPLPYDLTELQRDANRRFGFSAKKTSNVLQNLYERHKLVTYPRTDSRYLSQDMKQTMLDRLKAISSAFQQEVQPVLKNKGKVFAKSVFNDAKVTDHHAIIPTEQPVYFNDLNSDEQKLYRIIALRFLALFYPSYKYEVIQVHLEIAGEPFQLQEKQVIDDGFKKIENTRQESLSPSFDQWIIGKTLSVKEVHAERKMTEPPLRFSEADLLTKMEKYNLGTPATRAEIIERLLSQETIERTNGRLFVTPKGKQLIDLVHPSLKSPDLTAEWERKLESIAQGKENPDSFLNGIVNQTKQLIHDIKQSDQKYKLHNLTGSKCPECGSLMKEIKGKNGKILVCANHECGHRKHKGPKLSNRRCPHCHKKMEFHKGKAGAYFQCKPCNIVQKADEKKKKVSKREERQLLNKYSQKNNTPVGNSLADALKQALEDKN